MDWALSFSSVANWCAVKNDASQLWPISIIIVVRATMICLMSPRVRNTEKLLINYEF